MTYLQILLYQEKTMNDRLIRPWFGFRQERDVFKENLRFLRLHIALLVRRGHK